MKGMERLSMKLELGVRNQILGCSDLPGRSEVSLEAGNRRKLPPTLSEFASYRHLLCLYFHSVLKKFVSLLPNS